MKQVRILGAGLAGLTAAICLKNYDPKRKVVIYEKNNNVGLSHNNDFQHFDNWVEKKDVLEQLVEDTGFSVKPAVIKQFYGMTTFSPKGKKFELKSKKPFFYTVRRAPKNSLDDYLRNLAIERGVNILYNSDVHERSVNIVASGAKKLQGIACGYKFHTNLPDGITGFLNDDIAPKDYAYMVVIKGEATLATVLKPINFTNSRKCREEAFKKFKEYLGDFQTKNMRAFFGFDAYQNLKTRKKENRLYVGSAGGFQDTLFGFGMRQAIISGSLAAKSLYDNKDYDDLWKKRLYNEHKNEMIARMIFDKLSNHGYEALSRIIKSTQEIFDPDLQPFMHFVYNSRLVRCSFRPIAERYFKKRWGNLSEF